MSPSRRTHPKPLPAKFPPSEPCACAVCRAYCVRPGWWSVEQAESALKAGYAGRMMLEVAPDRSFGVLSPAFIGCEGTYAFKEFASRGCTFLKDERCELFGSAHQPLECRFCHHSRQGLGPVCHAALEADWSTPAGRALVIQWTRQRGLWKQLASVGLGKLRGSFY